MLVLSRPEELDDIIADLAFSARRVCSVFFVLENFDFSLRKSHLNYFSLELSRENLENQNSKKLGKNHF